jgi:hypothetical protein
VIAACERRKLTQAASCCGGAAVAFMLTPQV